MENKRLLSLFVLCIAEFLVAPIFAHANYKDDITQVYYVPPPKLKDGIYFGVGIGYDAYKIRQSVDLIPSPGTLITLDPALSAKGMLGTAYFGYGQYFNRFYVAGEVSAANTAAESSYGIGLPPRSYHVRLTIDESYTGAVLPGFRVDDKLLLYTRIGYVRTLFKSQEQGFNITGPTSLTTTNWGNAFQVGLGIEALLYKNWSIRGEYHYTSYSGFMTNLLTQFSPSNNQFNLGLLYHIC